MARTIGTIMVIVGIVMLVWTGFTYTKKEKVVDIGPLEVSADKKENVNWPPYVGGIVLVAGIVLLLAKKK
jgi:uncharacterized membrane protein